MRLTRGSGLDKEADLRHAGPSVTSGAALQVGPAKQDAYMVLPPTWAPRGGRACTDQMKGATPE